MNEITRRVMLVVAVGLVGLAIVIPMAMAGYDYDAPLGPDAIDALMPIPADTAKKFGRTEKVRLCYNIAELLKAINTQRIRIDLLEKQVVELRDIMATDLKDAPIEGQIRFDYYTGDKWTNIDDPNEVAK